MGKETEFGRKDYEIDEDAEEGDDDDGATDHASWDESEHFESMPTQYLDGDMEQKMAEARKSTAVAWREHVCLVPEINS